MSSSNQRSTQGLYIYDAHGRPVWVPGRRIETCHPSASGASAGGSSSGYDPSWAARARQLGVDQMHFSGVGATGNDTSVPATPGVASTPSHPAGPGRYRWVYSPGHPDLTAELGSAAPNTPVQTVSLPTTSVQGTPASYSAGTVSTSNLERFGPNATSYRNDIETAKLTDVDPFRTANINFCRSARHNGVDRRVGPRKKEESGFLKLHGRHWLSGDCARSDVCLRYLVEKRFLWGTDANTIREKVKEDARKRGEM
ncbi:hypothetical protein I302_104851 [Kwoniella bestiolae CBS 10118]|uniref:Uncharacterized protein n=1 Tax=Kwoniella bestiolae CBS 10118 TaxID=1296100 RepID=A0A1B9FRM7_9TREE|nr:hypothetical protein I302_09080 [Kwoniella bestiolae CBS 10118]OCF21402.1 hypothetical protein I302_09080 [Kwoniella bestiolae CBS 10118]